MERVDTTETKLESGKMRDDQSSTDDSQENLSPVEEPSGKEEDNSSLVQEVAPIDENPVLAPVPAVNVAPREQDLPSGPDETPEAVTIARSRNAAAVHLRPRTFHFYPMICYDEEPSYIRSGGPGPANRRVPREGEDFGNMRGNNNRFQRANILASRFDDGYLSGSEYEAPEVPEIDHGEVFLLDEELDIQREENERNEAIHLLEQDHPVKGPRPPRMAISDDDFVEMKRQERLAREPPRERKFEDKHVTAPRSLDRELSVDEYETLTSTTRCRQSGNRRVNPKELHSTNQLLTDYFRAESERLIPGLKDHHDPKMHLSILLNKDDAFEASQPIPIPQMPYQIKLEKYLKEREDAQRRGETDDSLPRMKPQLVDEDESPGIQFMRLRLIELARRSLMGYLVEELPTVEECLDPEFYQNLTKRFMMDIVPEPLYYYFNEDDDFVFHMDI